MARSSTERGKAHPKQLRIDFDNVTSEPWQMVVDNYERIQTLASAISHHHIAPGITKDDLAQHATIDAWKCAQRYIEREGTNKASFWTYASKRIFLGMVDYLRTRGQEIPLRVVRELRKVGRKINYQSIEDCSLLKYAELPDEASGEGSDQA